MLSTSGLNVTDSPLYCSLLLHSYKQILCPGREQTLPLYSGEYLYP